MVDFFLPILGQCWTPIVFSAMQFTLGGVKSMQIALLWWSDTSSEPSVVFDWWTCHKEQFYGQLKWQFRVVTYAETAPFKVTSPAWAQIFSERRSQNRSIEIFKTKRHLIEFFSSLCLYSPYAQDRLLNVWLLQEKNQLRKNEFNRNGIGNNAVYTWAYLIPRLKIIHTSVYGNGISLAACFLFFHFFGRVNMRFHAGLNPTQQCIFTSYRRTWLLTSRGRNNLCFFTMETRSSRWRSHLLESVVIGEQASRCYRLSVWVSHPFNVIYWIFFIYRQRLLTLNVVEDLDFIYCFRKPCNFSIIYYCRYNVIIDII
jgi:hypothetical protein